MSESTSIALVTGANRGIGFELSRTLARDHSFHVLLGSRNASSGAEAVSTLQAEGLSVELVVLDLGSNTSIFAAAKEVEQKYGRLDVLVNNAGIYIDKWVPESGGNVRATFQETFNTNVFGSASVTEAFVPLLTKSSLPRIVFISSILGSITNQVDPEGGWIHFSGVTYRCSKAAINMLCATYAMRFRDQGWKINTCCPGSVKTDINMHLGVMTTEEAMPNIVRLCTLGKDGETGTFSDANGALPW
ncbi:carbonyl reductase [Melanomma pulvis-pyrius CBS 109.77]|uniref:Carbonyl reductase n=1 Tax=Melanomma pulvis-pyrius CBS 109.77 TaxID=1314802 RepID=A0A6A6XA91_9PLEO|nr:carbonyl reductase [Melanomma pulvis-pyrius CBS 109.77]